MLSLPFRHGCNTCTECRPDTHSIDVLDCLVHHKGTDFFDPVWNCSGWSPLDSCWCNDIGCAVNIQVAEQIWGSLCGYNRHHVKIHWSEWMGNNWTYYIPTIITTQVLTLTQRDDHSDTHCYGNVNMCVIPLKTLAQIAVRIVWNSPKLVMKKQWTR